MQNHAGIANPQHWQNPFWKNGWDIRVFGILLVVAGVFDLVWISAYPNYALKVFGTTFEGVTGEIVKYQHPLIHKKLLLDTPQLAGGRKGASPRSGLNLVFFDA